MTPDDLASGRRPEVSRPLTDESIAAIVALRARATEAAYEAWYGESFWRALIDSDDAPLLDETDVAYLSAASPAVILALLAEVDRLRERIHPASDLTRSVCVSTFLLNDLLLRDWTGNRITAEWGEPDEDGFYSPTFTKHLDTSLQDAERARIRAAVEGLFQCWHMSEDHADHWTIDCAAVLAAIDGGDPAERECGNPDCCGDDGEE